MNRNKNTKTNYKNRDEIIYVPNLERYWINFLKSYIKIFEKKQ